MHDPLASSTHDAPIFAPDAFRLKPFQAELVDKARAFGRRVLAPRAAKYDREASFPIENFRDMQAQGWLAICIPAEEKHRLRASEPLFYFEFQAPNRFKTTILDGTEDDLRWNRVDGRVWVQT